MTVPRDTINALSATLLAHLAAFQRFARNRVGDDALAEDLVQESLLRAIRSAPAIKVEREVLAWFYRILRNVLIDHYRRAGRVKAAQGRLLAMSPETTEHPTAAPTLCGCVDQARESLRRNDAEMIRRVDTEGVPLVTVAHQLSISIVSAKVRLHRARKRLRVLVEESCRECAEAGCRDCHCENNGGVK